MSFLFFGSACTKLLEVKAPVTNLNAANVYNSDLTAASVLTGIYATMSKGSFATGRQSISLLSGLSSDEFTLYSGVTDNGCVAYYKNSLNANELLQGSEYWGEFYRYIFYCNSAIEGLDAATALSPSIKQQLYGEALFTRAFCYFYLVNLFGDVPVITTTDYKANATLPRNPVVDVYQYIITDLKAAKELLSGDYLDGNLQTSAAGERLRPTKWAALALLARAYLYTNNYAAADTAATSVIDQSSLFTLLDLDNVFLKNSQEAIWQLQPVASDRNTEDAFTFIIPASGPSDIAGGSAGNPCYLSPWLLEAFNAQDQRKTHWVNQVTVNNITYYYPYKYRLTTETPVNEYLTVLRLAEQYLIRAEARAQQNKLSAAVADLNIIRRRAGLQDTVAPSKEGLLASILQERQVELFSEWGHRWLDLKRTGKVNEIMSKVTPQKGGTWNANWQWYPLPADDIQKNARLVQNHGY
jgi:hypothetical protein